MKQPQTIRLPLSAIAEHLGARFKGNGDLLIEGVRPLDQAGPEHLSFLANKRYLAQLESSAAGAIIVSPTHEDLDRALIISEHPYEAMARAAQLLAPPPTLEVGPDPLAFIADDAELADGVAVGALAHIGSGSKIAAGTKIFGGVYVGRDVRIGADCLIHPNVTILDRCVIGDRVVIHSGTVIGSDGFGFAQDRKGRHVKIPQIGIVQIDDDVEIGSNCSIDRAAFDRTWIRKGCIIDNLVQIGHNVTVGEYSILVAQVGIAGSSRLGRHVVLGGQAGVAGHLEITDGVRVGATSSVAHSVSEKQDLLGSPAVNAKEWLRTFKQIQRLPKMSQQLKELQRKIEKLEKSVHPQQGERSSE